MTPGVGRLKKSENSKTKDHKTRYKKEKVAKVCSEIDYDRKSIYVQKKEKEPKNRKSEKIKILKSR